MVLDGISLDRLSDRRSLLASFDRMRRSIDSSGTMEGMDSFSRQALGILTSSKLATALDIERENPRVRERYGKGIPGNVADGGPICAAHGAEGMSGLLSVHLGTLRALRRSLDSEIGQLGRLRLGAEALAEAQEILFRFYRFHVGFELKSEPFLAQTLQGSGLTAVAS